MQNFIQNVRSGEGGGGREEVGEAGIMACILMGRLVYDNLHRFPLWTTIQGI